MPLSFLFWRLDLSEAIENWKTEKRRDLHPAAFDFLTYRLTIGYPEWERLQAMSVMSSVFFPSVRKCSDVRR